MRFKFTRLRRAPMGWDQGSLSTRVMGWIAVGCALSAGSCAGKVLPAKGQLMLAVKTDMKVPKDIDSVGIEVSSMGVILFSYEYQVGPDGLKIPATLGIVAGENPSLPVRIRVWARQATKVRILREVITTVPEDRIALLPVPIQWLCDGTATEDEALGIQSTCGEGKTCVAGTCVDSKVDSAVLSNYQPEQVFGGGTQERPGSCFDTMSCFSTYSRAVVRVEDCTIDAPSEPSRFNVGLVMPSGADGICGERECIVPLDSDAEFGWKEANGRVVLPPAVCTKLQDGSVLHVALTQTCETKTGQTPPCGPWSSVPAPQDPDAGPSADASPDASPEASPDGSDPSCLHSGDPTKATLCLHLKPESIRLIPTDPGLDGKGAYDIRVFDSPAIGSDGPVGNVLYGKSSDANETGDVYALPQPTIHGLPSKVYILSVFYDNAQEEFRFPNIFRGGAFVGGVDTSEGIKAGPALQEVVLQPGRGVSLDLPMRALRRLTVHINNQANLVPADDGQGHASWWAYGAPTITATTHAFGVSERTPCVNVLAGPVAVTGFVIGTDPVWLVGTFDDWNKGSSDSIPGSVPGSLVSGRPEGSDAWVAPEGDGFQFRPGQYSAEMVLTWQQRIPGGPFPTYSCGTSSCVPNRPCTNTGIQTCPTGMTACVQGQERCFPSVKAEECNGLDDDCDGVVDDGNPGQQSCSTHLSPPCDQGTTVCIGGNSECKTNIAPLDLEYPNGVDDNCDGKIDECNLANGVGKLHGELCLVEQCDPGFVDLNGRYDDGCEHPCSASKEICDGTDNDCNGKIDDGIAVDEQQSFCAAAHPTAMGVRTWGCFHGVCVVDQCLVSLFDNDRLAPNGCETTVCTVAPEICDGRDNDCNGLIDDAVIDPPSMLGCWEIPGTDCPGDDTSWNAPPGATCSNAGTLSAPCTPGVLTCVHGEWLCRNSVPPTFETCDGIDNDCNNQTDDVVGVTSVCSVNVGRCFQGVLHCNGTQIQCTGQYPLPEVCDGQDDDCDGATDEGVWGHPTACEESRGSCVSGLPVCVDGRKECAGGTGSQGEVCDGRDNDCDGVVDDGISCQ